MKTVTPTARRAWAALTGAVLLAVSPLSAEADDAPRTEDGVLTSFDGTPIVYSLFLPADASPASPAPVVLVTHGWGGSRAKTVGGRVATLLDGGYAVLTWDERGFGDSGGEANIDSQEYEVRDARALVDLVAARPEIQRDGPGDPRLGMLGGSYAGGIQLMLAGVDPRVDAIVPEITWHHLPTALRPAGVFKVGWGSLLYGAGAATATGDGLDSAAGPQAGAYAAEIHQGFAEAVAFNDWTPSTAAWFETRSPKHHLAGVRAPTLIVQGANDTLFNLNQAIANWQVIGANGVPAKLVVFCGGHVVNPDTTCADGADQGAVLERQWMAWLDRYVKDPRGDVETGPAVEFQLQDGTWASTPSLPVRRVGAAGRGVLVNPVAPTSGAVAAAQPAIDGVRIPVPVQPGDVILGLPRATVTVTGSGVEAYVFLKLLDVDSATGEAVVVDDQVQPRKFVSLSAAPQAQSFDLVGVSWQVLPGHQLYLEVASTSNDHASSRTPSVAEFQVSVDVPVF